MAYNGKMKEGRDRRAPPSPRSHSLSLRFLLIIATAIIVVIGAYQLFSLVRLSVADQDEAFRRSYAQAASLAKTMAQALADKDRAALDLIAGSAFADRELRYIRIVYPAATGQRDERFSNSVPWRPSVPAGLSWLGIRTEAEWPVQMFWMDQFQGTLRAGFLFGALIDTWNSQITFLLVEMLILLVGIGTLIFLAFQRFVSRPLAIVIRGLERIETGDFNLLLELGQKGEMAVLAGKINHMATSLKKLYGVLNDQNENLEALVNERTRLLVDSEKRATVSRLVTGVAHELNTPIGIVLMAASHEIEKAADISGKLSTQQLEKRELTDFLRDSLIDLAMIEKNTARAAELIQSFKRVSVDQFSDERQRFALIPYIRMIVPTIIRSLEDAGIFIEVIGDETLEMDSYPNFFTQIIVALVLNTEQHAFPPDFAGPRQVAITVEARDESIVLEYRNNGVRLGTDQLSHLFEPFYTTNRLKGCIGLGLYIVQSIVEQKMGGSIRVDQDGLPGWVAFIITLPLSGN